MSGTWCWKSKHDFDQILDARKKKTGAKFDTDLTAEDESHHRGL